MNKGGYSIIITNSYFAKTKVQQYWNNICHPLVKKSAAVNAKGTTIIIATHDYQVIKKFNARIIKCIEKKICEIESHEL